MAGKGGLAPQQCMLGARPGPPPQSPLPPPSSSSHHHRDGPPLCKDTDSLQTHRNRSFLSRVLNKLHPAGPGGDRRGSHVEGSMVPLRCGGSGLPGSTPVPEPTQPVPITCSDRAPLPSEPDDEPAAPPSPSSASEQLNHEFNPNTSSWLFGKNQSPAAETFTFSTGVENQHLSSSPSERTVRGGGTGDHSYADELAQIL
ncbi:unnamed protein product [Pleuronectes platessa]|uniref:Uncharacterized protein n=1 Tax=Pleuronectes platessa TaxID=8262 RepID=A0A9N7UVK5_PLEPL|nr:unnamed protein product [Pleuronectes platessa]